MGQEKNKDEVLNELLAHQIDDVIKSKDEAMRSKLKEIEEYPEYAGSRHPLDVLASAHAPWEVGAGVILSADCADARRATRTTAAGTRMLHFMRWTPTGWDGR